MTLSLVQKRPYHQCKLRGGLTASHTGVIPAPLWVFSAPGLRLHGCPHTIVITVGMAADGVHEMLMVKFMRHRYVPQHDFHGGLSWALSEGLTRGSAHISGPVLIDGWMLLAEGLVLRWTLRQPL